MSCRDAFYTPTVIAEQLVNYIQVERVYSAIDFCVGDGDLLKAVAKRYAGVSLYGTDISEESIINLRDRYNDWNLAVCNCQNIDMLNNIQFMRNKRFDLIVLNPPFTCKGSLVEHLEFDGVDFKLSTAMSFVVRALNFLSDDGGLYAILPISCVYSDKDKIIWQFLKEHYNACVLAEPNKVYFTKKCSPNIVFVYVGHRSIKCLPQINKDPFKNLPVVDIVRGSKRMQNVVYSKTANSVPLIHTTNIQHGKLVNLKSVILNVQKYVSGYGVVIPRICNPNPQKVALLNGCNKYVLSDCVMVLLTDNKVNAEIVRKNILCHWSDFVSLYKGTGAQYTTVARMKNAFGIG